MSNYEALVKTNREYNGWNSYDDDRYSYSVPKSVTFMVKGTVKVFRPKEVK